MAKKAAAVKKADVKKPAVVQPATADASKPKDRTVKLAIVARSLRGINRNLRLQGNKGLEVRKVKGKDGSSFQVFKGAAKTGKAVLHDGNPIKSIGTLTYGQWVTAAVKVA